MKNYRNRIADDILKRKLEGKGAVVIEGPKWCGKTTTAEQIAKSVLYMDDPSNKAQNITISETNPKQLLRGKTPRLIDEWQIAPKLWDTIRFEVDHRGELGQFVLTGSAVPADTHEITHSGTGRFTWLMMRPMSLYESGESNGTVSLKELFEGKEKIEGYADLTFERLAFVVCRGGWPQAIDMKDEEALKQPRCYYNTHVHSDINKADNIKKNPESVKRLMRSYARSQGSQVPNTVLVHGDLINDLQTFGFLFETLCIRDLRIYADSLGGEVYHYRDKDGLECDAVMHLRNGKYGLIEIKLGGDTLIEEGARNLKAMEAKIDTDKMNTPSFLMVLTGVGNYAYRRKDGVFVVPIGSLKN